MTEQRKSLSPFDIWHVSSKPILLSHVLPAPWRSASPRVWDLVGWVQSGIQERILHTAQAQLVSVGQKTPLEEEGSIKISCVWEALQKNHADSSKLPSLCAHSVKAPARAELPVNSSPDRAPVLTGFFLRDLYYQTNISRLRLCFTTSSSLAVPECLTVF